MSTCPDAINFEASCCQFSAMSIDFGRCSSTLAFCMKQVEMLDVATILRDFSSETLVLVDELGR